MSQNATEETFAEQKVTYTLQVEERFVVIENVPARVSLRTGERFFSPETTERLQKIVWEAKKPARFIETPVFEYSVG